MKEPDIPENEAERLINLNEYQILDSISEEEYDDITALAAQICQTPVSLISLLDENRQWFKSHHGLALKELPRNISFCGHTIKNSDYDAFIVNDARKDDRFYDNPLVTGELQVIFYAGIPLISSKGYPLGTICVIDHQPHQLNENQVNSLKLLSRQVMRLIELRKNKIKLKESEEFHRILKENNSDAVYLVEANGEILEANPAATRMTGYSNEELVGAHLNLIDPDFSAEAFDSFWENLSEEETLLFESSHIRKDGTQLPVEVSSICFIKNDQKLVYSIARDISKRKSTEQALEKREERYRLLFENINEAFTIFEIYKDENGQPIDLIFNEINPAFEKLTGYPIEKIKNKSIYDTFPDVAEFWVQETAPTVMKGEPMHFTYYSERLEKYFEMRMFCPKEGLIAITFSDVTQSRISHKKLEESQKLYKTIFDTTNDGIFIYASRNKIAFVNQAALGMYNLSEEEMLNLKPRELVDKNNHALLDQFFDTIDNNEEFHGETSFTRMDGKLIYVMIYGCPLLIGGEKYYFGALKDITTQVKHQEELAEKNKEIARQNEEYMATNEELVESNNKILQINDQLEKANKELDNFVYRVSHDLRAPIASSLGLAELTLKSSDIEEVHTYTRMQMDSLKRLDRFIQDILNYSRNSRLEIVPEKIEFENLIDQAFLENQHVEDTENINIKKNLQINAEFKSDKLRINTVFRNLISNALKYLDPYKQAPYVKIEIQTNEYYADITIEDNGIGIDSTYQERVYDMFYRANEKKPGSGIGLYIVKDCLNKLGGSISLESKIEKGTTFYVRIPNLAFINQ